MFWKQELRWKQVREHGPKNVGQLWPLILGLSMCKSGKIRKQGTHDLGISEAVAQQFGCIDDFAAGSGVLEK